jgi:hypothetical protein
MFIQFVSGFADGEGDEAEPDVQLGLQRVQRRRNANFVQICKNLK